MCVVAARGRYPSTRSYVTLSLHHHIYGRNKPSLTCAMHLTTFAHINPTTYASSSNRTIHKQNIAYLFLLAETLLNSELLVADNHQQTALSWYMKAAEQNHAMAALRLSKAYAAGDLGLEKDEQKAQYWSNQFMQHSQNMSNPS